MPAVGRKQLYLFVLNAGSWDGALFFARFWGRRLRAVLLNPPPFECQLGNSTTTVIQRRSSHEHLPGDSTTTVVS